MKTYTKTAQKYLDLLEVRKKENGTDDTYICFTEKALKEKTKEEKALTDIICSLGYDIDNAYNFTYEALALITDNEPQTEDELNELIDQIESDVYTSDLTKWLHSHNENVYYLTEALEETDIKDGFQLLAYAQEKAKREVFYKVAELIIKEDK